MKPSPSSGKDRVRVVMYPLSSPLDEPRTSSEAACALRNVCAAEPLSQDAGVLGPE